MIMKNSSTVCEKKMYLCNWQKDEDMRMSEMVLAEGHC